jgi:diguanylate cyclase (GGDEF)-like protein/PAS domain S-box-containing protein
MEVLMSLRVKFALYMIGMFAVLLGFAYFDGEFDVYHYSLLLVFGVWALGVLLWVFERFVLSRLKKIQTMMDTISSKWRLDLRIYQDGEDEITNLSRAFNVALDALDAFIINIPDPLFLSDADGIVLLTNAEAVKLLGYEDESGIVGQPLKSFIFEKTQTEGMEPGGDLPPDAGHVFEAMMRRSDQNFVPVEVHQERFIAGPNIMTLAVARNLTERKAMEARLVKMAFYDSQTSLPNRHYFLDDLDREFRKIKENPAYMFCVVFINMDKFKLINEQLGPRGADEVLIEVVRCINKIMKGFASTFRMEGDEFSVIIRGTNSKEYIESNLQRLRRLISTPVYVDGKTVFPSASFGVVMDICESNDASQILALATDAIATGKKSGMGGITYISALEGVEALKRENRQNLLTVQADMRRGLSCSEFLPYFQPIYQLSPSRLSGFEALVRWRHPQNELLSPAMFIHHAEETGFITEIDKSIISQSIQRLKKWTEAYPKMPFFVSANASGASFSDPSFVPFVLNQLEEAKMPPGYFVLEVTEGIFIENFQDTIDKLKLLKDQGVKIALDDFGTGYSSLQYVSQLPLNYIKIDKSFIDQLVSSDKATLMVTSIIEMAGRLGFSVVAEGVENEAQLNWLSEYEGTKVQGYIFSPPVSVSDAENLLTDASLFADVTS